MHPLPLQVRLLEPKDAPRACVMLKIMGAARLPEKVKAMLTNGSRICLGLFSINNNLVGLLIAKNEGNGKVTKIEHFFVKAIECLGHHETAAAKLLEGLKKEVPRGNYIKIEVQSQDNFLMEAMKENGFVPARNSTNDKTSHTLFQFGSEAKDRVLKSIAQILKGRGQYVR